MQVYLLLGRNGSINGFIGTMLSELGYDVIGQNINESFQQ